MKGFGRLIKCSLVLTFAVIVIYVGLLIVPNVLFAHQVAYKQFSVYSDRPIDANISIVLNDVADRLSYSELYSESTQLNIYLCHDNWRFTLLTRNPNAGGQVNFLLSSNIFIRDCDIASNKLIPPSGWMFEMDSRPLSYFIAHESVHAFQRKFDPLMIITTPVHVIEGYADYIAKRPAFDFREYAELLLQNDPSMNPKNGLYKRYHLYNAILIDSLGMTFQEIVSNPPELETTLDYCRN
ncbi:MAG: hypothetical protein H6603_01995 [Flavobacteriales bacterium]|nr:hypothetical protein [Flavobacteriales bacterium]MCB9203723.1 hypothetical protein [Flavobacteriales bacterium]